MNILGRIKNAFRAFGYNISIDQLDELMERAGGQPSLSGVNVSNDSALSFSAFFNGVMQISQTVASLPFPVYMQEGEGKRGKYRKHPLYGLLNRKAAPQMSSFQWRETITQHALVWGNGYSFKVLDRTGCPAKYILMNPARMHVETKAGEVEYVYRDKDGRDRRYYFEQIFHIPGIGFDGIQGYSILQVARESIGLGLAMQEFGARYFGQGTHLGGFIKRPTEAPKLADAALVRLKEDLKSKYQGLGKAHQVMLLEDGMEFQSITMPLKDAEFLASKQFQIQDIARWLNMPPHKLKDLSKSSFNNIEQEQLSYLQDTIRPWAVRWEDRVNAFEISDREAPYVYAEHVLEAMLRGDIKTRFEAFGIARQNGVMNADEWRAFENWNEIGGDVGKKYLVNGNMIDVAQIGKPVAVGAIPMKYKEADNAQTE